MRVSELKPILKEFELFYLTPLASWAAATPSSLHPSEARARQKQQRVAAAAAAAAASAAGLWEIQREEGGGGRAFFFDSNGYTPNMLV
jgi:hypothetical protein